MIFKLYQSAICIGEADLCGAPQFRFCAQDSGEWGPWAPVAPPFGAPELVPLGFDLCLIAENVSQMAQFFASVADGETATAPWGRRYTRRGDALLGRDTKFCIDLWFDGGQPFAFCAANLNCTYVLVREGMEQKTVLAAWERAGVSAPEHKAVFHGTEMIAMRDGVHLATHVWLPEGANGPLPTILYRTPYNAMMAKNHCMRFVRRGYALVMQDLRGREQSEGEFIALGSERNDGSDTLDWIAAQPWSNGDVGTIGASYGGFVQWEMAASGNEHLKCMVSQVTGGTPFQDLPRRGGTLMCGMLPWAAMMSTRCLDLKSRERMARDDWDEVFQMRPLASIPERIFCEKVATWDAWMREPTDSFWLEPDWRRGLGARVPVMIESGWFDDDHQGSMSAWDVARNLPRDKRFLLLGPWLHGGNSQRDSHGHPLGNDAIVYELDLYWQRWFDQHLKQRDMGFAAEQPTRYYMLGANEWRTSDTFPPEDFCTQTFYLGDGTLNKAEQESGTVCYCYDPRDPAPHIVDPSENEMSVPGNYREVEQRSDVICFDFPVTQELEIAGCPEIEFYAASSAVDTDWVVRVTDVDEAGNSIKLGENIVCARYRNGYERAELLTPGKPEKYALRLGWFANRFAAGHTLRVHITSSAARLAFPNPNTGEPIAQSTDCRKADQTVYFGGLYPSRITFSVKD